MSLIVQKRPAYRIQLLMGLVGFAGFASIGFLLVNEESEHQISRQLLLDLAAKAITPPNESSPAKIPEQRNYFEQPSLRQWRETTNYQGRTVYSYRRLATALAKFGSSSGNTNGTLNGEAGKAANQVLMELARGTRLPYAVINSPSVSHGGAGQKTNHEPGWHPDIYQVLDLFLLHLAMARSTGDEQKVRAMLLIYLRWIEALNRPCDLESRLTAQAHNQRFLSILTDAVGTGMLDGATFDAIDHHLKNWNDLALLEEGLRAGSLEQLESFDQRIDEDRREAGLFSTQRLIVEMHHSLVVKPSRSTLCDYWRVVLGSPALNDWSAAARRVDDIHERMQAHRDSLQGLRRGLFFKLKPNISAETFRLAAHNLFMRRAVLVSIKVERLLLEGQYNPDAALSIMTDAIYDDLAQSGQELNIFGGIISPSADHKCYMIYLEMPKAKREKETKVGRPWYVRRMLSSGRSNPQRPRSVDRYLPPQKT